jgi:hypothetical protein
MPTTVAEALIERRWWYGGPRDIWIKHVDVVQKLITEQKLKPVDPTHYIPDLPSNATSLAEEGAAKAFRRIPFPGGIRLPHVHFKGDMYLLSGEQWKDFSGKLVKEFQSKLSKAHVLSFDSLMELSAAIDTVPLPE